MSGVPQTRGRADEGFEPVLAAFESNFAEKGEVGAAFCAYVDGVKVADLWAGEAAPGRPWDTDTIAPIFSVTKGAAALVAQMLADRRQLDVEERVINYWPEFGAEGKQDVPVKALLNHTVGLPSFPRILGPRQLR